MKRHKITHFYYKKLALLVVFGIFISLCLYYPISRKMVSKTFSKNIVYTAKSDVKRFTSSRNLSRHKHRNVVKKVIPVVETKSKYSSVWNPKEWSEFHKNLNMTDSRYFLPINSSFISFIDNKGLECRDQGENLTLLMGIKSAPSNFKSRSDIRKTWGVKASQLGVKLLFITGTTADIRTTLRVKLEKKKNMDIIECDFNDAYYNLTLKSIMFYKWTVTHCPLVKHVAKLDDDSIVNLPKLVAHLKEIAPNKAAGHLWQKPEASRSDKFKYYLPKDIYPWEFHPDFLSGGFIILGIEAVRAIYQESHNVIYFNLDDVYETGMIVAALEGRVQLMDWKELITPFQGATDYCGKIAYTDRHRKRFRAIWRKMTLEKCPDV